MCSSVYYSIHDQDIQVYFPTPKAQLPVKTRSGGIITLAWGRRHKQAGTLPLGGWARLDSIYAGHWDRWFPVAVKIPIKSFMEKDFEDHDHWYDLTRAQWIQGLVARHRQERRVYVVTIEPELAEAIHDRWPRIMNG